MKKFILLFSLTSCLFLTSLNAQVIDSIVISQPIECPGGRGDFVVYTTPATSPYDIVLQRMEVNPTPTFQSHKIGQWTNSNTSTTVTFSNLSSGVYRVLLTNINCSPPYQSNFNLNPDTCIYAHEVELRMVDPQQLTYTVVPASLDCWYDTTADLTINNIDGYTRPYSLTLFDANGAVLNNITLGLTDDSTTFINLSAGTYTVRVTDVNTCPAVDTQVDIIANDTIKPEIAIIDSISCYNANDGVIEASVLSGGTSPFDYHWIDVSTGDTVFTELSVIASQYQAVGPGSYYCIIQDSLGCDTLTSTVTLFNPPMLSAVAQITQTIDCKDLCNGEITVTLDSLGAGPPFNFTLRDSITGALVDSITSFTTTAVFPGLCADVITYYKVTIYDVDGCDSILNSIELTEPDSITFDTTLTNPVCHGDCNGQIVLSNFNGGNLPNYGTSLVYYIFNQGLDTAEVARDSSIIDSNLCAGIYSYQVFDTLGCVSDVYTVDLQEPVLFEIDARDSLVYSNGTNVTCPGENDAQFNVEPINPASILIGGQITYYLNGSTSANDSAPAPNTVIIDDQFASNSLIASGISTTGYTVVEAIDSEGCVARDSIFLVEPPLFELSLTAEPENCFQANGEVYAQVSGGDSLYTYHWTGPSLNQTNVSLDQQDTISNLTYGTYTCFVTDNLGCSTDTLSIFVDTTVILIDITVLRKCNNVDAKIILNSNGTLLNSLLWTTANANGTSTGDTLKLLPYSTPPYFNIDTLSVNDLLVDSLGEGLYWYEVQRDGCNPYRDTVRIGEDLIVDAFLVSHPDSSLTELECFGDVTDLITIDVNQNFSLVTPPLSFVPSVAFRYKNITTGDLTDINDAPYNILDDTAFGGPLPSGDYNIVVYPDSFTYGQARQCTDTVLVSVTEPDSLEFTLDYISNVCFGDSTGTVYVSSISGGNLGEYNFIWTNSLGDTISFADTVDNLPAGLYYLSVTDTLNCLPATEASIELMQPDEVIATYTITAIDSCAGTGGITGNNSIGEFHIQTVGGIPYANGKYDLVWQGLNFTSPIIQTIDSPLDSLYALPADTFVLLISDSLGCSREDTVVINDGLNPAVDSSSYTNISCNGLSDGSFIAIIDSVNGSQSYPYTFLNPSTGVWGQGYIPSGSGYAAGDSVVINVRDDFGCEEEIVYVFTEPDSLIIRNVWDSTYVGGLNIRCFNERNGYIMIDSVTGGTLPYYYSINGTTGPVAGGFYNPDSTDNAFDSLAAAWYYTDVIDANGCTYRDSITLTQPDSLLIDSFTISTYVGGWGVSCFGFNDGSAFGHVSGGMYDSTLYDYNYTWSSISDTSASTNNDTIIDLYANNWYTLHVVDTNGCEARDSIELTQPTPLAIDSFTINNVLCVGGDRGNATVWVSGATPTYTYLWNNGDTIMPTYLNPNDTVGSNNDTTALADTLRAGDYVVNIHDANGCHISDTITITEPTISVEIDSLVVTQITCYNYNNGSVDIIATGPEPLPYLYTVYEESNPSNIPSQGNLGFNQGLSPATYVAHVQDGIGCVDRDTFVIDPVDSVYIVNVQWQDLSCHGFDDGYVWDIVATGGTSPYEYSIDGGTTRYPSWLCNNQNPSCPTGYVFTGLDPGVHTIEIYDSNNCANSYAFTVTEPSPMQFAISTNNYNNYQILCDGEKDTAFIAVSGGDPIYTIIKTVVINGDSDTNTTSSTYDWIDIEEGWHLFEIFDANNCMVDTNIYFAAPDQFDNTGSTQVNVFCQDSCDGSINAVITGGVGQGNGNSYQYSWTDSQGNILGTNFSIQNLCPGTDYTLQVTDDNGCSDVFIYDIDSEVLEIDSLATANPNNSIDPSCFGYCDGSITIVVNGGVPSQTPGQASYYYQWDDPLSQTDATAIGLCAESNGTTIVYKCIVTDMAGCKVSAEFVLGQPDELEVSITEIEPVSCHGSSDGELIAVGSGGTNPYDFTWSQGTILNGQLTSTVSGLAPGLYSVFVEDDNGCTETADYDLTEPQPLDLPITNIDISDVKCYGDATGSIQAEAIGGTPIPGIPGSYKYVLLDENDNPISTVVTSPSTVFDGLNTGVYKIEVTDYNGCTYVTGDIYVDQPDEPLSALIEGVNGTCDPNSPEPADPVVSVYISGGTTDYSYEFFDSNGNLVSNGTGSSGSTNVNAPDVGFADYSVLVTDKNGCTIDASTRVRGYENIFLPDNSNTFSDIVCQGGLIQIPVEECDGCTYFWTRSQDIIANTSSLEIYSDISWLPIEILTLNITDENGCETTIDVTIEKDDVNAAATPQVNVTPGSSVTLSSASGFSTYVWTNEFGDTVSTEKDYDIFDVQESAWFWLYVESNAGCKDYDSSYVIVGSQPVDAFSPNGDGYNDYWYVEDIDQFSGNKVQIYNRWGELIFEDSCSPNCWDGKIDGKDAPVGAYYYIIDHNDGTDLIKGSITLIR